MYIFSKKDAIDSWKNKNSPSNKVEKKDFTQRIIKESSNIIKLILTHNPTGNSWLYNLPLNYDESNIENLLNSIVTKEEVISEDLINSKYQYLNSNARML